MNNSLIKLLKEDLKVSHKGKKYRACINGKECVVKTPDDLVKEILTNTASLKNNSNWQDYRTYTESEIKDDENFFEDILPKDLSEAIEFIEIEKTNINDKLHGKIEASAFNGFSKELSELPKIGFNEIDKEILKRLRYCEKDTCIYIKKNRRLNLIGKLNSLKQDPTQFGLCQFIKEEIGQAFNNGEPMKIDAYISRCLKKVTDLWHQIRKETKLQLDKSVPFDEIKIDLGEDGVFVTKDKCYGEDKNAIENAINNFCIERLWELVPCSLFTAKIIILKSIYNVYEIPNDNGPNIKSFEFVKYAYEVVRSGEALTEATYLKNIFNTYAAELKDGEKYKLEEVPNTYGNIIYYMNEKGEKEGIVPKNTLHVFDIEVLKEECAKFKPYGKLEDCKNLSLLKSWMNADEFRLTMAWAYAAICPNSEKSSIALLLWTGGGTGKTSFVDIIKHAMMIGSDSKKEDIYFQIKGVDFLKDTKNWQPDNKVGLPKAALVNIDEATTECIDEIKNFTGSADGNSKVLRQNYENSIDYDIKGKFILTTNRGLQLTSDDGSLLRRIAVIKHEEIQNGIGGEAMTSEEIVIDFKRQIPMLLKIGRQCVEEIKQMKYKSIDEYAMKCPNIRKNLQESTSLSKNEEIYERIWDMIEESYPNGKDENNAYRVQGQVLKALYERVTSEDSDENYYASFKKFITTHRELFEGENKQPKSSRNCLVFTKSSTEPMIVPGPIPRAFKLYRLKRPQDMNKDNEIDEL